MMRLHERLRASSELVHVMGLPQQEQHGARYQHADQEIGRVHHRVVEQIGRICSTKVTISSPA